MTHTVWVTKVFKIIPYFPFLHILSINYYYCYGIMSVNKTMIQINFTTIILLFKNKIISLWLYAVFIPQPNIYFYRQTYIYMTEVKSLYFSYSILHFCFCKKTGCLLIANIKSMMKWSKQTESSFLQIINLNWGTYMINHFTPTVWQYFIVKKIHFYRSDILMKIQKQ